MFLGCFYDQLCDLILVFVSLNASKFVREIWASKVLEWDNKGRNCSGIQVV